MTEEEFIAEWNRPNKKVPKKKPEDKPNFKIIYEDYGLGLGDWKELDWAEMEKRVFNLQKRIYKATINGQVSKAKSLMKLLFRSTCAIVLGVRRVTQDNKGSKTAGVDRYKAATPKERIEMVSEMLEQSKKRWQGYQAMPAKRKYIPKANGKKRPLGIPTQKDRVVQHLVKTTIEPYYEAKFESGSYGFRPAMSTHDAIQDIWLHTKGKKLKWILDADIKGCFDNIDHEYLLTNIEEKWKPFIREWLKAGYVEDRHIKHTNTGTPQGGIISPLLANIVLDGMENYLKSTLKKHNPERWGEWIDKVKVVRYADDFVVIHENKQIVEACQKLLEIWLKKRGLELSPEKTKIVSTETGFDFLGFTIRHYMGNKAKGHYKRALAKAGKLRKEDEYTLRITPSKKAEQKHRDRLREVFNQIKGWPQDKVIERLNPIIRGWANYYRFIDSSKTFSSMQSYMWIKLWKWSRRRHSKKGKKWVKRKYFHKSEISPAGWHFKTKKSKLAFYRESKVKIGTYRRVRDDSSFYDGQEMYWANRRSKGYGSITPSRAKLLRKQDGKCPICKARFKDGDSMESHHILYRSKGGEDKYSNLALLHRHCHDQIHASTITRTRGGKNNNDNAQEKDIIITRTTKGNRLIKIVEKAYHKIHKFVNQKTNGRVNPTQFNKIVSRIAKEGPDSHRISKPPRKSVIKRAIDEVVFKIYQI